jgi:hypothetical protein
VLDDFVVVVVGNFRDEVDKLGEEDVDVEAC